MGILAAGPAVAETAIELEDIDPAASREEPSAGPDADASDLPTLQLKTLPYAVLEAVNDGDVDKLVIALGDAGCFPDCSSRLSEAPLLQHAIQAGDLDILKALLSFGADVNQRSWPLAWTPLMFAIKELDREATELLLEHGANPDLVGLDGATARQLAELAQMTDLIAPPTLILDRQQADLLLLHAAELGSADIARQALDAGADTGARSPANDWSAVMIAAFHGNWEVVDTIAARNPDDPSPFRISVGDEGITALHAALIGLSDPKREEELDCTLRSLLVAGASPGDSGSVTPLRATAENLGRSAILDALLPASGEMKVCERLPDGSIRLADAKEQGRYLARQGWTDGGMAGDGEPITLIHPGYSGYLTNNSNIRTGPSTGYDVLVVLPAGTELLVHGGPVDERWARVTLPDGREGYVSAALLSHTPPSEDVYGAVCIFRSSGGYDLSFVNGFSDPKDAHRQAVEAATAAQCENSGTVKNDECFASFLSGPENLTPDNHKIVYSVGQGLEQAVEKALEACLDLGVAGNYCHRFKSFCAR